MRDNIDGMREYHSHDTGVSSAVVRHFICMRVSLYVRMMNICTYARYDGKSER